MSSNAERRSVQRFEFAEAIEATMSGQPVKLVDLSTRGAGILHTTPFHAGRLGKLEFSCEGERVVVIAEVVRCRFGKGPEGGVSYRSGLRFHVTSAQSLEPVRNVLVSLVSRSIQMQKRAARQPLTASA